MAALQRELELFEATVYGFGLIVGAGIYSILGEVARITGESVVLAFLLAAGVALLTGLSFAELAARYPRASAEYTYVQRAFGSRPLSRSTALLRIAEGAFSAATVALAFAGYLSGVLPLPNVPVALAVVIVMAVVNFWGIDVSIKITILFTAIEVLGLLLVIWAGVGAWGTVDVFELPTGVGGLVQGTFLIFFAYTGFGSLVTVTEETERATEAIPKAILLAIGASTLLYVLVGLSSVGVVDWRTIGRAAVAEPLATVARAGGVPVIATAVSGIALFSTSNTVLIVMISTSRLLYGVSAAESGTPRPPGRTEPQSSSSEASHPDFALFPPVFARIHSMTHTPHVAVAAVAGVTGLFTLLGDIGQVAGFANLALLTDFLLVNAALIKLRYSSGRDETGEGFRVPLTVGRMPLPALGGALTSVALIAFYGVRTLGI